MPSIKPVKRVKQISKIRPNAGEKRSIFFYQIESGKIVGWTPGTDNDDPSSTKKVMQAWVDKDPQNRSIVTGNKIVKDPIYVAGVGQSVGQIKPMTDQERSDMKQSQKDKEAADEQKKIQMIKSTRKKLMDGDPLTKEEVDMILPDPGGN